MILNKTYYMTVFITDNGDRDKPFVGVTTAWDLEMDEVKRML